MASPSRNNGRSYNGQYMEDGKRAEEIVLRFLKDQPSVVDVEDYRELKPMQRMDVDFGVEIADGRISLVEVKSDGNMGVTGNVLFEVLRINHTAPPSKSCVLGWAARSPARYLIIYSPAVHKLYKCTFNDLRRSFQRYTQDKRGETKSVWIDTDDIKSTFVFLIPWKYCKDIFSIHEVEKYEPEPEPEPFA